MSTELTQEKLKKIAVAHRVNPYADIIPYELGFGFPQIYYSGFFTQPDEFILYAAPAYTFKDKTQITGYTGRTAGVSVRVAKGVSIRTGGYGGKPIRGTVRDCNYGDIIITNKRVVFIGKDDNFDFAVEKITAVKILDAFSFVIKAGRSSKNIGTDAAILNYITGFINYSIQAYNEGRNLFEKRAELERGISQEEIELCNQVRNMINKIKIRKLNKNGCLWTVAKILGVTVVLAIISLIVILIAVPKNENVKENEPTVTDKSIIELLTLPNHPLIYDNYTDAVNFYKNIGDSRIEVTTISEHAQKQRNLKSIHDDKTILYLIQHSTNKDYIGTIQINLYDSTGKDMTLEGAVELITSYLPDYFGKYYRMTDCYKYENDGTVIYVYAARLNDAGIVFQNESAPYLSPYYYIKLIKYADGEHWKLETGYSANGGKDKGWIEKYAEPWEFNFADYLS